MGGEGFEPSKRVARQVYSLIPLATRTPPQKGRATRVRDLIQVLKSLGDVRFGDRTAPVCWRRDLNPQPPVYKTGALPIELRQRCVLSLERRCALSELDELGSPEARVGITSLCMKVKMIFHFFNHHLFFSPSLDPLLPPLTPSHSISRPQKCAQGALTRRCRLASYNNTPAATEALRLSVRPRIGIEAM